ncbi:hypothetical protein OH807_30635 [Kitasatospora sp. NBC_01560]|uniref:hypothetical protein n=1 Tax=Kitasatospora sp. NBC_01560 TaxID=2975965 RepID=UPI0038682674
MADEVDSGRLVFKVATDLAGFAQETRAKVEAATRNLRAQVRLEPDTRGLRQRVEAASRAAAARVIVGITLDGGDLRRRAQAAARAAATRVDASLALNTAAASAAAAQWRERVAQPVEVPLVAVGQAAGGGASVTPAAETAVPSTISAAGAAPVRLEVEAAGLRQRVEAAASEARTSIRLPLEAEAGDLRAQVEQAAKAAATTILIGLRPDADDLRRRARPAVEAATRNLRARVPLDPDSTGLRQRVQAAAQAARTRIRVAVDVDTSGLAERIRAATARAAYVRVGVAFDTGNLRQRVQAAAKAAASTVKIDLDVDTAGLRSRVRAALAGLSVTVRVDVDTAAAATRVAAFRTLAGRPLDIPLNVSGSGAGGGLAQAAGGLGSTIAGLMRLPAMASGALALGQALTQAAGGLFAMGAAAAPAVGLLGALPGAMSAAAQGGGTILAAFSGIGAAVKALGQADTQSAGASNAAAQARQAAADRVADAQRRLGAAQRDTDEQSLRGAEQVAQARRRLADVQEEAAASVAAADRQLAAAELTVTRAHQAATRAQEALNDARREAQRSLEDLTRDAARGPLEEQKALLSLEQARSRLNEVNTSPFASETDRREAQIAFQEATNQLEDVRVRNRRLAEDVKKANQDGIEGSDQVTAAKQELTRAQEAEQDAVRGSQDAEQQAARARVEAVREVQDAHTDLDRTVRDTERQQKRSAEQIADAQRDVARALRDQTQALAGGSVAANAVAATLDKLSPAGQRFARFIQGTVQPALRGLRDTAQEALLPPLETAITRGLQLLPIFDSALAQTGQVIGQVAIRGAEMATSGPWRADLAQIGTTNAQVLGRLGNAGLGVADIFRNITVAAGPLVLRLADGIERGVAIAGAFIQARRDGGQLAAFFVQAGDTGAQLWAILRDGAVVLFNVGQAAAPAGRVLLDSLAGAVAAARQLSGEVSAQDKLRGYFANTVPVVQELGRLVVAVGVAWFNFTNNPSLAPLIARLRTEFLPAVVQLAGALGNGQLWGQLLSLVTSVANIAAELGGLGNTLSGFLFVIQAVATAVQVLLSIPGMGAFVSALLTMAGVAAGIMAVSNAIAAVRVAMLALSANPVMLIVTAVAALVLAFVTAYQKSEWFRSVVNGAISGLADGIRFAVDSLVGFVKAIWPTLMTIFATPIRFWVNVVYDGGIRKLWNWIADSFGLGKLPSFTVGFARGGVVPGYAPGRDTVPAMLSPGEGVLIPQAVRQLGGEGGITALNDAARAGRLAQAGAPVEGYFLGGLVDAGLDRLRGWAAGALAKALNPVRSWFNWMPDNRWGDMLRGMVNRAVDGVLSFVRGYATGGVVPGYAPGQDSALARLSPGEGVLTPQAVRGLGGSSAVGAINAARGQLADGGQGDRIGTVISPGAIVQYITNPLPETPGQTVNNRLRALASFGLFDKESA